MKKQSIFCIVSVIFLCICGVLSLYSKPFSSENDEKKGRVILREPSKQITEDLRITSDGEGEIDMPLLVITNIELVQDLLPVGVLNTLQQESGLFLKHHNITDVITHIDSNSITYFHENPSFQCPLKDSVTLVITYDTKVKILRFKLQQ